MIKVSKMLQDDKVSVKCPNCGFYELEKRVYTEAVVSDGDGFSSCYDVDYYFCQNCEKWYDEDFDGCDEPQQ